MSDDGRPDADQPIVLAGDKNLSADEMERITSGQLYEITPQH